MARKPTLKNKIKRFIRKYPSIPLFLISFTLGVALILLSLAGNQ